MSSVAVAPTLTATDVCDDASCREAWSHVSLCTCRCGGRGHSGAHRAHFPTKAKRTVSNPYAQAARDDAVDAAFGIAPLTRRANVMYDADDML